MSNAPKPTTPKLTDEEIKTLAENEAAHKAAELAAVEQAIADDEAAGVNPSGIPDAVETVEAPLLAEINLSDGTDLEWWTPSAEAAVVEFDRQSSFTALLKANVYAAFATDNEADLRAALEGVVTIVQQWVAKLDRA